ncbi:unnamed protein product, partial [Prorocentrum cordatum]
WPESAAGPPAGAPAPPSRAAPRGGTPLVAARPAMNPVALAAVGLRRELREEHLLQGDGDTTPSARGAVDEDSLAPSSAGAADGPAPRPGAAWPPACADLLEGLCGICRGPGAASAAGQPVEPEECEGPAPRCAARREEQEVEGRAVGAVLRRGPRRPPPAVPPRRRPRVRGRPPAGLAEPPRTRGRVAPSGRRRGQAPHVDASFCGFGSGLSRGCLGLGGAVVVGGDPPLACKLSAAMYEGLNDGRLVAQVAIWFSTAGMRS